MNVDDRVEEKAAGAETRAVDVEDCEVQLQLGVHAKRLGIDRSPDWDLAHQATTSFFTL